MGNNEYNMVDAMACVRGASDGAKDATEGKTCALHGRASAYIEGYNAAYLFKIVLTVLAE